MSAFLVWGAGGHGKVVADLVRATGNRVFGHVATDAETLGKQVEPGGGTVVVLQETLLEALRAGRGLPTGADAVVLAIGDNHRRWEYLQEHETIPFPELIHPSALLSPSARVGPASVVLPGAIINANARIGKGVIVNTGAIVEHDCQIDDAVHLSPRATLAGGVRVGRWSWVGAGATIIQGVSIGQGVTVGAGAAVIRDVPDGATVVGVPAIPIR